MALSRLRRIRANEADEHSNFVVALTFIVLNALLPKANGVGYSRQRYHRPDHGVMQQNVQDDHNQDENAQQDRP